MTVLEPILNWLVSNGLKTVTLPQIMKETDKPRKPVLRVMDKLVREGYAEEIKDDKVPLRQGEFGVPRRNPTWKLLEKPLSERPIKRPKKRCLRDRIWTAVRRKRIFTRKDIMRTTGVSLGSVGDYTKLLARNGYLRVEGNDGHQKVFKLVKGLREVNRPIIKEKSDE